MNENISNLSNWKLQEPELDGYFEFSGHSYITKGIHDELPASEIAWIITAIKEHVYKNFGTDYLLVFTNEAGRKIFAIDNIDLDTKKRLDADYVNANDYYTIMFVEEY